MKTKAIKNITQHVETKGIIISLSCGEDFEKVSYEENFDGTIAVDRPIKWIKKVDGKKQSMKSFSEKELTNKLIMLVESVVSRFADFEGEHHRLYL